MAFADVQSLMSRMPWPHNVRAPAWDDLAAGALPRDDALIGRIVDQLHQGPVCLVAPSNRGKTFLGYMISRAVADRAHGRTVCVKYAEAQWLEPGAAIRELTEAITSCRRLYPSASHISYLYVVDDCHLEEELAESLAERADPPAVTLLLTMRGASEDDLPQWAWQLYAERPEQVFLLESDVMSAAAIAETYLVRSDS